MNLLDNEADMTEILTNLPANFPLAPLISSFISRAFAHKSGIRKISQVRRIMADNYAEKIARKLHNIKTKNSFKISEKNCCGICQQEIGVEEFVLIPSTMNFFHTCCYFNRFK